MYWILIFVWLIPFINLCFFIICFRYINTIQKQMCYHLINSINHINHTFNYLYDNQGETITKKQHFENMKNIKRSVNALYSEKINMLDIYNKIK